MTTMRMKVYVVEMESTVLDKSDAEPGCTAVEIFSTKFIALNYMRKMKMDFINDEVAQYDSAEATLFTQEDANRWLTSQRKVKDDISEEDLDAAIVKVQQGAYAEYICTWRVLEKTVDGRVSASIALPLPIHEVDNVASEPSKKRKHIKE